jgi:hypothetical protein
MKGGKRAIAVERQEQSISLHRLPTPDASLAWYASAGKKIVPCTAKRLWVATPQLIFDVKYVTFPPIHQFLREVPSRVGRKDSTGTGLRMA